jgi:hypothetical protein
VRDQSGAPRQSTPSRSPKAKATEANRVLKQQQKAEKERDKKRQKVITAAKKAKRDKVTGKDKTIKELLGMQLWYEEKVSQRRYYAELRSCFP